LECPKGLFQIEADTNFKVAQKVAPKNLEQLSAVVAIARPGALDFMDRYADYARNGDFQSVHEFFDDVLSYTGGIPLYQEQLMKMAVKVGFSLDEAEQLRRIVGKKKVDQMGEWKNKISDKIQENNLDPAIGEVLWKVAEDSANYSFNKCAYEEDIVELEDGSQAKLKNIKIGDKIKALDIEIGQDHFVEVIDIMKNEKEIFEFEMVNGLTVRCSMDHKFLCYHDMKMHPMKDILENNWEIVSIMQTTTIKSFKPFGIKNTIDLEVNHPDHNFYLEGLVTSNSHSISYAYLAAITIFLKFNYPRQFFLSLLKFAQFEPSPHEEILKISQELPAFNIKLLPPSLAKSEIDFSIEGSDIRYGLNTIKGVSTKVLESLLEFRQSEFQNKYEVFMAAKQAGVNIGVLSALIQAGLLDHFVAKDRCRLALEAQTFNILTEREKRNMIAIGPRYNYDILESISDCVKTKAIGDDNKVIFSEKRFNTFKSKYSGYREVYDQNKKHIKYANWYFETQLLGYSYSQNIRDVFKASSSAHFISSQELMGVANNASVCCVGSVVDCVSRTSSNGNKYARIDLSDERGNISLLLMDNSRENKLSNYLASNKKLPKKGEVIIAVGRKNNDIIMLDRISLLEDKIYMRLSELK
jgi:DNA polymerase III alpha subunit